MLRIVELTLLSCVLFFTGCTYNSDFDVYDLGEFQVKRNDGRIKSAYMWALRQIKKHPYLTATALWLGYFKGRDTGQFIKEIASSWYIAIPVGGAVLYSAVDFLLRLDRYACEDDDQLCEFTHTLNESKSFEDVF